jgi:hypothetical protein
MNSIPAMIAFAPAFLLPLVQDWLRPRVPHASLLGFVLSWAPNFVVGVCFPFSILMRPRVWTARVAAHLFHVWAAFTLFVLVLCEFWDPFGPNTFDPADIAASGGGVALALVFFHAILRARLTFGEALPPPALVTEPSQSG